MKSLLPLAQSIEHVLEFDWERSFDLKGLRRILALKSQPRGVQKHSIQTQRFSMFVLGAFAILALALAAVGIYGVMSYVVAQRTREIGIRIALGASLENILGLVLKNGLLLTTIGILLGAAAAFGFWFWGLVHGGIVGRDVDSEVRVHRCGCGRNAGGGTGTT